MLPSNDFCGNWPSWGNSWIEVRMLSEIYGLSNDCFAVLVGMFLIETLCLLFVYVEIIQMALGSVNCSALA